MRATSSAPGLRRRKISAYAVHFLTATGAVWGFLALLAIIDHDWKKMFVFMMIGLLIDSADGHLARLADTKRYAPNIDGGLLDNIIDYLTFVIVPSLFFFVSDVLPAGWGLSIACAILLSSAYQFSQANAKTEDHFFTGFPCYWNLVALYMLVLGLNPWINLAILLVLVVLVFVPIKYIYPSRTSHFFWLTNSLMLLLIVAGIYGFYLYPNVPPWVIWLCLGISVYYVGLSLWLQRKEKSTL
jgi:phosphatidylcholine synthase